MGERPFPSPSGARVVGFLALENLIDVQLVATDAHVAEAARRSETTSYGHSIVRYAQIVGKRFHAVLS